MKPLKPSAAPITRKTSLAQTLPGRAYARNLIFIEACSLNKNTLVYQMKRLINGAAVVIAITRVIPQ